MKISEKSFPKKTSNSSAGKGNPIKTTPSGGWPAVTKGKGASNVPKDFPQVRGKGGKKSKMSY